MPWNDGWKALSKTEVLWLDVQIVVSKTRVPYLDVQIVISKIWVPYLEVQKVVSKTWVRYLDVQKGLSEIRVACLILGTLLSKTEVERGIVCPAAEGRRERPESESPHRFLMGHASGRDGRIPRCIR